MSRFDARRFLVPMCQACGVRHFAEDCPAFKKAAKEAGPSLTGEAIYLADKDSKKK